MRVFHKFRAGLIGLIAIVCASASSPTYADGGPIRFSVLKAGWFIGGSGGRGELIFHGRRYPLTIGGLSAGLVFGAIRNAAAVPGVDALRGAHCG